MNYRGYNLIASRVLKRLAENKEHSALWELYTKGGQLERDAYLKDWTKEEGKIWLYDYDFQKFEYEVNKFPEEIEKLEEDLKNATGFFKRKIREQLQRQIYQRKSDLAEAKHRLDSKDKFDKYIQEDCGGKSLNELKKQLEQMKKATTKTVFYENFDNPDVNELFTQALCERGVLIKSENKYPVAILIDEVIYDEAKLVIKKKYEKEIAERRNEVALGKEQETDEENE